MISCSNSGCTDVCHKLLIYSSILSHLDQYSILHNEQHEFRHKVSCDIHSMNIPTIYDLAKYLDSELWSDVAIFLKSFCQSGS